MRTVRQVLHIAFSSRKGGFMAMVCIFPTLLLISPPLQAAPSSLLVFAGAASKPATEEVARLFTRKKGIEVRISFGGSGFVLSQMKLARKGDVYFPGSSDFMEKAKGEGLVFPETEKTVAYLVPAINVQKGNPRNIRSLKDLLKPGVRVGIADPGAVCVGIYAVEVMERNLAPEEQARFRKNLATMVESCERTANLISLRSVDAVMGWRVFEHWDPGRIETVLLKREEVPRIGYFPAAVSTFTGERDRAEDFVRFLVSSEAQSVFRRLGYLTTVEEARRYTLPGTPVGGEYSLPDPWWRKTR